MKKTAFLYDARYLLHYTGLFHPEVPDRLPAIYQGIEKAGLLSKLNRVLAVLPNMKWVEAVHDRKYIDRLGDACLSGKKSFDCPGNPINH